MKTPTGYVALRKGRNNVRNCIFLNWFDAEIHINEYDDAEYSVIDTLQDAEKYIISTSNSNNNNKNINKCPPLLLEEFAKVATTSHDDESTLANNDNDNSNNKRAAVVARSLASPPLLPPATTATTIDDDIDNDNDADAGTTSANTANNNMNATNTATSSVVVAEQSSTPAPPLPPLLPPATLDIEIDNNNNNNYRSDEIMQHNINTTTNTTKESSRDISMLSSQHNQAIIKTTTPALASVPEKATTTTSSTAPSSSTPWPPSLLLLPPAATTTTIIDAFPASDDNDNINEIHHQNKNKTIGTTVIKDSIQKRNLYNKDAKHNNNNLGVLAASAVTAAHNNNKSMSSNSITLKTSKKDTTAATTKSNNYNLSKDWICYFNKLISYRKSDGTYPKPIPDYEVDMWLYIQRKEYKNKKKKNSSSLRRCNNNNDNNDNSLYLNDDMELLLRSVGIDLDSNTPTANNDNNDNSDTSSSSSISVNSNNSNLNYSYDDDDSNDNVATIKTTNSIVTKQQHDVKQNTNGQNSSNNNNNMDNNNKHQSNNNPAFPVEVAVDTTVKTSLQTTTNLRNSNTATTTTAATTPLLTKKRNIDDYDYNNNNCNNLRNKDGSFPESIPDYNVRAWLHHQHNLYRNNNNSLLNDKKEEMLRAVGISFGNDSILFEKIIKQKQPARKRTKFTTNSSNNHHPNTSMVATATTTSVCNTPAVSEATSTRTRSTKKKMKTSSFNKSISTETKKGELHEFQKRWKKHFEKLDSCRRSDGTLCTRMMDAKTRQWLTNQKRLYKNKVLGLKNAQYLSDERIELLQSIGIDLNIDRCNQKTSNSNKNDDGNNGDSSVTGNPAIDDTAKATTATKKQHFQSWDEEFEIMLAQLKDYKMKHGSSYVIKKHKQEYQILHYWVEKIKTEYRKLGDKATANRSRLSTVQIAQLTEIGLQLNMNRKNNKSFDEWIDELKEYQNDGGDINKINNSNSKFSNFIARQRKDYRYWCQGKRNFINERKIKILESMGLDWKVDRWVEPEKKANFKSWDERFQDLLNFKAKHGHTLVPKRMGKLGMWVQWQRQHYKFMLQGKKTQMTPEKALKLTNIGFVFDASEYQFKQVPMNNNEMNDDDDDDGESSTHNSEVSN